MEDINLYYKILGIEFGATLDEVKKAYQEEIKVWTNNRFSADPKLRKEAQDKIREINLAYENIKKHLWYFYKKDFQIQRSFKKDEKSNFKKWVIGYCSFLIIGILLSITYYLYTNYFRTLTWEDIFEKSKTSVVVIKINDFIGSGFFISSNGLIMTNAHLVTQYNQTNPSPIEVKLNSGQVKYAVTIREGVPPLDVAIIKIDGEDYKSLKMSIPSKCREGEEIIAIGAPLGLDYSITKGIISSCNRDIEGVKIIQTDTPINEGNSGGPILNKSGEVIAISTFKVKEKGVEGLNFAIPIDFAKEFIDGKLSILETTLRAKREAEERQLLERVQKLIYNAEQIYKVLSDIYRKEHNRYVDRLDFQIKYRYISYEQGKILLNSKRYPPSGYSSVNEWLKALTLKIMKKELSPEEAINMIYGNFAT